MSICVEVLRTNGAQKLFELPDDRVIGIRTGSVPLLSGNLPAEQ